MFVSTHTPSVLWGGGKVVLVFEIIYLFLDLQVIFDGQMISIINSILFQIFCDLIVCHWWAGNFVNKFCHSSSTIVMCRGVTRLAGAWDKKKVWGPHIRTWGLREANVLFWKSAHGIVVSFGPCSDSASGEYSPCPTRYVSGVMQLKSENVPKIDKFSYPKSWTSIP